MKAAITPLLLVLTATSGIAGANEIYKWTDPDGNVIYGDRPQDEAMASVERVPISSRATNAEAVSASIEARRDRDAARADARTEREEAEQAAADARAEAEKTAQQCSEYRARLEKMITSRRLYRLNDDGEREYLDDAGMQSARDALQERIQEQCSG